MNIPAQVSATARLTNSNNQSIHSKSYSLTGDGTSGSVSGQYLLPTSLNQTTLGRVSLVGSTSGTGSSIGNFSASLIYTADPCVSNPLYNSSCSGYSVAFAKNMLLGSTVASASGSSMPTGNNMNSMSSPTGNMDQSNPQPEQTQQPQQQLQQQQGPAQDTNQNPSISQDNPSQPSPTQQGPGSTSPQPAGGPPQNATASNSSGPSSGSAGPSKLAMSVLKTAQDKDKATQNSAVASAAKTLEGSIQQSQASSNAAISMVQDMSANSAVAAAQFSSQNTQASVQASTQFNQQQATQSSMQTPQGSRAGTQTQQQQDSQQTQIQSTNIIQTPQFVYSPPLQPQQDTQATQVTMLKPPTTQEVETQQHNIGTGITVSRNMFVYNPLTTPSSTNISSATQPTSMYQPKLDSNQYEVETPQYQMSSFSGIGKAGNPLSEIIMQQRFELMQNNIAQPTSSVNRNVIPNELAGSIDIASIASVPAGFNAYSFILKDASFYEPKEVYKNQRTIDNERVLRGLTRGSDSLHQQMVDQQYK
jgi:hypothetical protein